MAWLKIRVQIMQSSKSPKELCLIATAMNPFPIHILRKLNLKNLVTKKDGDVLLHSSLYKGLDHGHQSHTMGPAKAS